MRSDRTRKTEDDLDALAALEAGGDRKIEVDLGELYNDCHLKKALKGRGKEQDATLERMATVIAAIQDSGFRVGYKLGGLVGTLTRDTALTSRSGELKAAIRKVLRTLDQLGG